MLIRFFIYGLLGWGMEIVWTGLHSLFRGDYRLMGTTSLWMFLIYGLAVFLEPIYSLLASRPLALRGGIYMLCIFIAEYAAGWWLRGMVGACPWDYSTSRFQIQGVIRLDYAPVWFAVGIFYEKIYHMMLRFV